MADVKISRPENDKDFSQKSIEKDMMSYMVLFDVSKNEAYLRFNPHFCNQTTGKINEAGKEECRQFFDNQRNKDYIRAYKETLNKRLSGVELKTEENFSIDGKRKDIALQSLLDQAMRIVERDTNLDPDTLKTITEIFRKLNILKEDEIETEAPRRYLPVRCVSECQYRAFCEKAIEKGEIENECLYCKALAIAKEHGYIYDPTTNLNIPTK